MVKLIIVFFVVPLSCFSQFFMSTDFAERKDAAGKEIAAVHLLNSFSIGTLVNNNLILGISAEPAVADYIEYGNNPVQDSLVVSAFQVFLRKNFRDYFVFIKVPAYTDFAEISTVDRARIGGGYIVYKTESFNLEISYSALLSANEDGFRKGKLSIGASTSLAEIKRFLF